MDKIDAKFSVVIPYYNEEKTLERCVERVRELQDEHISLEIVIVDDCSKDNSFQIATKLANEHREIRVVRHEKNQGKGAALRTGFKAVIGDFVAVQDADLEYNPLELKKLLEPLLRDEADVVFGSRFLSGGAHRILYFWHYIGNKFLTLLSCMFTDLNMTDMETCYKVFRREIIQKIAIKENRFGFEPEIVAKVARMRLRIYEIVISYNGRTYAEGKKIGFKDGLRAFYCVVRYNASSAPLPMQFLFYLVIGGISAVANILGFMGLLKTGIGVTVSALIAFYAAAAINYILCIFVLFRHNARWNSFMEAVLYVVLISVIGAFDITSTNMLIRAGFSAFIAKSLATLFGLILNFAARRFFIFPEPAAGPWK